MNSEKESQESGPAPARRLLPPVSHYHPPPHQIISLAFLSGHPPAGLISQHFARALYTETDASILLVRFAIQETDVPAKEAKQPQAFLNGEFRMPPRFLKTEEGFHSVTLGLRPDDPPSPPG